MAETTARVKKGKECIGHPFPLLSRYGSKANSRIERLSLDLIPPHGEGLLVDLMEPGGKVSQDGFDPEGLLYLKEI